MTSYISPECTVCFILLPDVHVLDLAGAAQVFYEASQFGPARYRIRFCSLTKELATEQGLTLSNLENPARIELKNGDLIVVPGISFFKFKGGAMATEIGKLTPWMIRQRKLGVRLATICSGALILAEMGILDGLKCTTHWKCIDYMKKQYPNVRVLTDRLFVNDGPVLTSAGMISGIDLALSILEDGHGPLLAARVAREMVVYMRRNSTDRQETIYLDYKTHFNPCIHKVQDHIISHPSKNYPLEALALIGNISVRNLTRLFKKTTGHTIVEFKNAVKLEMARTYVNNPEYTMERIASLCGFESARHLRRLMGRK